MASSNFYQFRVKGRPILGRTNEQLSDHYPNIDNGEDTHATPPWNVETGSSSGSNNFAESTSTTSSLESKQISINRWEKNFCPLCKQNGEPDASFRSHGLKDATGIVTCPVLRKYQCRYCGATGDVAHTDSYCPKKPIGRSVCLALKSTTRHSMGSRSKNYTRVQL